MAAAPRRATIVQVKRKAHEAAAESLYIAAKRSKRNEGESADDEADEERRREEREQPSAKRHVFRRVESLQQADIDRGGHFELLRRLREEAPEEFKRQGVKARVKASATASARRRQRASAKEARFHIVEQRRFGQDGPDVSHGADSQRSPSGTEDAAEANKNGGISILEIETVGVKAERDLHQMDATLAGLTVTCNGAAMRPRVLSSEEKAQREAIIKQRRSLDSDRHESLLDAVPVGAPPSPYAKDLGSREEGGFVYDYYFAYADDLDLSRGRFDLDVAVDQWASDEESPDGDEAAAIFGVDDEDSNDEGHWQNDYPDRDPSDPESGQSDDADASFFRRTQIATGIAGDDALLSSDEEDDSSSWRRLMRNNTSERDSSLEQLRHQWGSYKSALQSSEIDDLGTDARRIHRTEEQEEEEEKEDSFYY